MTFSIDSIINHPMPNIDPDRFNNPTLNPPQINGSMINQDTGYGEDDFDFHHSYGGDQPMAGEEEAQDSSGTESDSTDTDNMQEEIPQQTATQEAPKDKSYISPEKAPLQRIYEKRPLHHIHVRKLVLERNFLSQAEPIYGDLQVRDMDNARHAQLKSCYQPPESVEKSILDEKASQYRERERVYGIQRLAISESLAEINQVFDAIRRQDKANQHKAREQNSIPLAGRLSIFDSFRS